MSFADYFIIIFVLFLMIFIGIRAKGDSADFSDYIRMGSRSTWWLAGSSIFMGTFSAITFTGICGSAYLAGWSVLIIFWCNALMFLIQALFFAPLMRRTRADTPQDAIRLRFGPLIEQIQSYIGMFSSFIWGGMFLLSLATFVSVVFQIPIWVVIVFTGGVVVFYSVAGGSFSVQITDALQAIILLPVTIAFAGLCLYHVGWLGGMAALIREQGLSQDFALIKSAGHVYQSAIPVEKGMFTPLWFVAMVWNALLNSASLNSSFRYLSLKDEKSSRNAAVLAGFLMVVGSLIWFIPAVVGRLLFANEVEAVEGLGNKADAAYAITAMKILPPGFLGLILVAMLSATMSSMDSFLTGTAGMIVKNIYLPLSRRLRWNTLSGPALLKLTRWVNLALGIWAIIGAFLLRELSGPGGIFGIIMNVFALVTAPFAVPLAIALLTRRIPIWGYFCGVVAGIIASLTVFILQRQGITFEWSTRLFITSLSPLLPTLVSTLFWKQTKPEFKAHVENFFETIHRPIKTTSEIKSVIDNQLLRSVATYVSISALGILCLLVTTSTVEGAIAVTGVAGFMLSIAAFMFFKARKPDQNPAA